MPALTARGAARVRHFSTRLRAHLDIAALHGTLGCCSEACGRLSHRSGAGRSMAPVLCLIACALLMLSSPAFALVPAQYEYIADVDNIVAGKRWWPSQQEACEAAKPRLKVQNVSASSVTFSKCGPTDLVYHADFYDASGNWVGGWGGVLNRRYWSCPANSTSVTGGCLCNTGYQEDGAQTTCEAAAPEPPICRIAGLSTPNPIPRPPRSTATNSTGATAVRPR